MHGIVPRDSCMLVLLHNTEGQNAHRLTDHFIQKSSDKKAGPLDSVLR